MLWGLSLLIFIISNVLFVVVSAIRKLSSIVLIYFVYLQVKMSLQVEYVCVYVWILFN